MFLSLQKITRSWLVIMSFFVYYSFNVPFTFSYLWRLKESSSNLPVDQVGWSQTGASLWTVISLQCDWQVQKLISVLRNFYSNLTLHGIQTHDQYTHLMKTAQTRLGVARLSWWVTHRTSCVHAQRNHIIIGYSLRWVCQLLPKSI